MAPSEDINGVDEDVQQDKKQRKAAKHDDGVADLERVTDYAEEREIQFDIKNAVDLFGDKRSKETEARLAKEQELQKVQIKKEDVEMIVNEMLISRSQAEQVLREHMGNVVAALTELTN